MHITVITLFPELFSSVLTTSIIKRTLTQKKASITFLNLRDFGIGSHKTVDDKPYGGGVGMVLRVDVVDRAIQSARKNVKNEKVTLLDPKGIPYTQKKAREYSNLEHLILVCGHYEGIDERVRTLVDEEVSVGDYVLSGGEIAAITVIDSILRLVPGALKHTSATEIESFSEVNSELLLEFPQYTRPEEYNKEKVPEILLSGNHQEIEKFRLDEARKVTRAKRPDLLKN